MPEQLSADFVVIGSGIIGSLAALKFLKQGASVIILEAGPPVTRGEIVGRFRNSPRKGDWMSPYPPSPWAPHPIYQPKDNGYLVQAGPYPYPAEYIRQVGGTTWHWAAQAWRVVPNDLRIHSLYGVGVDWPISYEELDPFYQEAEDIMGVSGLPNTGSPRSKPFPMEPVAETWAMRRIRERLAPGGYEVVGNTTARNSRTYDGRPACCGNNSCQPICPIDAQYHGGIAAADAHAAGAQLIPNAVVYKIEPDPQGRIAAVHYYDPNKTSHRVTGKTFILAANGIESPKLLLISTSDKYPKGLANSSDMVGRHLMDHPSTSITFDADEELWLGRGPQSPNSINTMRDGAFRSEYSAYRLDFTNISRVLGATQALIDAGVYGIELEKRLRHSAAFEMSLKNVLEVLPHPENRITISAEKDAMGIPKPEAHYSIDNYTRKGAEVSGKDFARIAELMGGTNLRYSKEGSFANNQHITGTMSMGMDPKTSVVDSYGRTHDHENLFIASTGIMPTAATCNSTMTGLALALRTAKHILGAAENKPSPNTSASKS
ncbi:GMC family oxidoreductase [Paralcaligenes sp. KSB-10]|jgi:choline dehydrogenase-like flavoprotein|uniref:GMC family oxidoreductase n=1 Tax=Paralcaligenes sp. KSB-10 TaxID=2901142 RepID=UPI001E602B37|nr:GMC family oxidoreductase [Paralcaligenes sp. KSB-10]UHL64565.1 GMC family oxidoreductase [Paralcaligenes sp. KSB-10]